MEDWKPLTSEQKECERQTYIVAITDTCMCIELLIDDQKMAGKAIKMKSDEWHVILDTKTILAKTSSEIVEDSGTTLHPPTLNISSKAKSYI